MEKVQMFWDPVGFELDSFGASKIRGAPTAGDTSYVRTSIRIPSIDTPTIHYPVNSNAPNHASRPQALAGWIDLGIASNKHKLCGLFLLIYLYIFYFLKGGIYEESI